MPNDLHNFAAPVSAALDCFQPSRLNPHQTFQLSQLGVRSMLWTLFVILLVLWLIGVVSSYTLGGFIHILLVLAIIALIFQLISGRRTVV